MRRYLPFVVLAALAPPLRAADPFDAAAAAKVLAPFVDQQTIAVGRADVRAADDAIALVTRLAGPAAGDLAKGLTAVKATADQLAKAGIRDLFVVVSLDDVPAGGPILVVPMPAGADENAARAALKSLAPTEAQRYGSSLVAAAPRTHQRLKAAAPSPRPDLAVALAAVPAAMPIQAVLVPTPDHRKALSESLPKLPPQLGPEPAKALARGLTWAALSVGIAPGLDAKLMVKSEDADAARIFAGMIKAGLTLLAGSQEVKQVPALGTLLGQLEPKTDGDRVTLEFGGATAALAETVAEAATKMRQAAARSVSTNNLKQIALAWHNYHDGQKAFPSNQMSKDGRPLLSWRVLILPYLDQSELYKQFKLDEPWDSDHNKALIAKMPVTYRAPAQKAEGGKTTYLAPRGQGGPNGATVVGMAGTQIRHITDGTSNTIMVVESNDDAAVIWTKPDDLEVTEANPSKGLFGHYPEVFNAAFGDGSVRAISKSVDPKMLWALFTRNGGEVIKLQ